MGEKEICGQGRRVEPYEIEVRLFGRGGNKWAQQGVGPYEIGVRLFGRGGNK